MYRGVDGKEGCHVGPPVFLADGQRGFTDRVMFTIIDLSLLSLAVIIGEILQVSYPREGVYLTKLSAGKLQDDLLLLLRRLRLQVLQDCLIKRFPSNAPYLEGVAGLRMRGRKG